MRRFRCLRLRQCLAAAFLAEGAVGGSLRAEPYPSFDLHGCTAEARLIVRGELTSDGSLQVREVLKGTLPAAFSSASGLPVESGASYHERLGLTGGAGPVEVVAFLNGGRRGGWVLVRQLAGFVRLREGMVSVHRDGWEWTVAKMLDLTPSEFLGAVRQSLQAAGAAEELLARPRSPERVRALLGFLLGHDTPPAEGEPEPGAGITCIESLPPSDRAKRPKRTWSLKR